MIEIKINNNKFFINSGVSVLEACEFIGFHIPKFCYHQTLSIAGNCRMCLVEIANSPKPIASCALPVSNNMTIFVNSPLVKKARENIVEMLLLNHPLDCPICDQGGECDLQDQAKMFGLDNSRFFFKKRAVEDKYCGPLIRTIMSRCIHCTRCVRFNSEISGKSFFGTLNRGTLTEIGSYKKSSYSSVISGNVIDLCPVGALTSNFYSFKARPWELITIQSIDTTDGLGSSTYLSVKESEIFRIFPKQNTEINNNLISDRARFYYDSNKSNRLKINSKKKNISYKLKNFWNNLKMNMNSNHSNKIVFLADSFLDFESLTSLKISESLNIAKHKIVVKLTSANLSKKNFNISWLNNSFLNVELANKLCIILASSISIENPIIVNKLKIIQNNKNMKIMKLGLYSNELEESNLINLNLSKVYKIFESKILSLSSLFTNTEKPLVVYNNALFKRGSESLFLINFLKNINLNTLLLKTSSMSNSTGTEFLGFNHVNSKVLLEENTNIICLNVENSSFFKKILNNFDSKNITWLNSHYSEICLQSNKSLKLLLSKTEFEEEKALINLEGRIQHTAKSVSSLFKSISVKQFLNSFIENFYKKNLPLKNKYNNSFSFLRELLKKSLTFSSVSKTKFFNSLLLKSLFKINTSYLISNYPVICNHEDLYLANKTLSNSSNIQDCSIASRKATTNFY